MGGESDGVEERRKLYRESESETEETEKSVMNENHKVVFCFFAKIRSVILSPPAAGEVGNRIFFYSFFSKKWKKLHFGSMNDVWQFQMPELWNKSHDERGEWERVRCFISDSTQEVLSQCVRSQSEALMPRASLQNSFQHLELTHRPQRLLFTARGTGSSSSTSSSSSLLQRLQQWASLKPDAVFISSTQRSQNLNRQRKAASSHSLLGCSSGLFHWCFPISSVNDSSCKRTLNNNTTIIIKKKHNLS